MKTLEEYNKEKFERYNKDSSDRRTNGIQCKCGLELVDSNPDITLTSWPPKKEVHCERCGFTGYRYV